jgi:hypothetical protein
MRNDILRMNLMEDVTSYFTTYRECARHLWNTYFQPIAQAPGSLDQSWNVRDRFDNIARALFSSLVLLPLGVDDAELAPANSAEPMPLRGFRLVPSGEYGAPININRDLPRSGYWDHPLSVVRPTDVDLRLLRFFDFDELGHRDFKHYEALIAASATHPEIVGRAALIECAYVTVFQSEKSS